MGWTSRGIQRDLSTFYLVLTKQDKVSKNLSKGNPVELSRMKNQLNTGIPACGLS